MTWKVLTRSFASQSRYCLWVNIFLRLTDHEVDLHTTIARWNVYICGKGWNTLATDVSDKTHNISSRRIYCLAYLFGLLLQERNQNQFSVAETLTNNDATFTNKLRLPHLIHYSLLLSKPTPEQPRNTSQLRFSDFITMRFFAILATLVAAIFGTTSGKYIFLFEPQELR